MTKRTAIRRVLALLLLVCAGLRRPGLPAGGFAGVAPRRTGASWRSENTQREFRQAPRRGDILDAHGNLLATSVPVKTVCADPSLIGNQQAVVAHALAPLLQMNEAELYQRLFPRVSEECKGRNGHEQSALCPAAKNVPEETWQQIQTAMSQSAFGVDEKKLSRSRPRVFPEPAPDAIFAEPDQMRVYPNGSLAAQVLGFPAWTSSNWTADRFRRLSGATASNWR